MIACPNCDFENIDGSDVCEKCQQPLVFVGTAQPASELEQSILKDRIRKLSPREPLVVPVTATVGEVLKLLVEHRVGCIVVVEGRKVVGIFSERDALMRLNVRFANLMDRPISEFMTPHPETLNLDDRIAFALHKMDLGGYRHIPVLENGQIAGVISVRDILRYVSDTVMAAQA